MSYGDISIMVIAVDDRGGVGKGDCGSEDDNQPVC